MLPIQPAFSHYKCYHCEHHHHYLW